jgi:hypothetical protein
MFAHTNAAYISFLTILKTATFGAGLPSGNLEYVYNNLYGTRQTGRVKGFSKHFLMSNEGYINELVNNTASLDVSPNPGHEGGKRISTETEFGTFMRGHQPSMIKAPSLFGSKKNPAALKREGASTNLMAKLGGRIRRRTKNRKSRRRRTKKKRKRRRTKKRKRRRTKKKRRRRK